MVKNKFFHGGNVYKVAKQLSCDIKEITDLSSNVIPLVWVYDFIDIKPWWLNILPEPHSYSLIKKISYYFSLSEDEIIVTSGSTELIKEICHIFSNNKAAIISPTYVDYEKFCILHNIKINYIPFSNICLDHKYDLVFICNPNNPTGAVLEKNFLEEVISNYPNTLFVIDESYINFLKNEKELSFLGSNLLNIIVLRSFSKIYGIPGIRVGWGFSKNKTLIKKLKHRISEWSVNTIAQHLCINLLDQVNIIEIRNRINKIKTWFIKELNKIDIFQPLPSKTNYILIKLKNITPSEAYKICLKNKILIRDCSNFYGLDGSFIRVSIKEKQDMTKFLNVFSPTYYKD